MRYVCSENVELSKYLRMSRFYSTTVDTFMGMPITHELTSIRALISSTLEVQLRDHDLKLEKLENVLNVTKSQAVSLMFGNHEQFHIGELLYFLLAVSVELKVDIEEESPFAYLDRLLNEVSEELRIIILSLFDDMGVEYTESPISITLPDKVRA